MKLLASQIKSVSSHLFSPETSTHLAFYAPRGLHNQMRGMGTWGVGTGNARRDRGPPAIERTRAGRQQCVWGQDLACVPGIPSFTCSLLMRLNSKKLQFPKCVWAMGIYIWWKCHLESNQSTFMVENTHHVVQWELLYLHSALRTNSVP